MTRRTLSLLLVISALAGPAESLESNLYYSVEQHMREKHCDSTAISAAIATWRTLVAAISGTASWDAARTTYAEASVQPWFADSYITAFIPPKMPPAETEIEGLKKFLFYDPATTLQKVRTPTLALFGALDRNVDVAHAAPTLRLDFAQAGMKGFTEHLFKDAGHTFKVSETGFNDQPAKPERLKAGYPEIMIHWLSERGFRN